MNSAMSGYNILGHSAYVDRLELKRLLLLDGYGSHCILEFVTFCEAHKIISICLPFYFTHLFQPLNVIIF